MQREQQAMVSRYLVQQRIPANYAKRALPQGRFPDKTGGTHMATPNTKPATVADTRSPLQKIFSSTNLVLFMVCLMYGLTYIDRINVNTAGPSISARLASEHRATGLGVLRVRMGVPGVAGLGRMAQ